MVNNLTCPKCDSKNTVYKKENAFECKDCNHKWSKISIQLPKTPDLLENILNEDKKRKIPNISIYKNSLERRRK